MIYCGINVLISRYSALCIANLTIQADIYGLLSILETIQTETCQK